MFTYILLNSIVFLSTFIFSFENRIKYFSKWGKYIISTSIVAIFMLLLDYIFTEAGIWGFSDEYLTGIFVGPLPIEEILFFFAIPYSSMFIYEVVKYISGNRKQYYTGILNRLLLFFGFIIIIVALIFSAKIYTFVHFVLLGILIFVTLYLKPKHLTEFIVAFGLTIIPFLLVNGLLTSGLDFISQNPVVWYNNAQNLGIRIGSIPIEDLFYGMFMLMGNFLIYEKFLNRNEQN